MPAPTHPPIVCVGFPRWEGGNYLKSTVQLMTELARTRRVLYVDYPYTLKDMWQAWRGQTTDVPLAALLGREARLQNRQLSGEGGSLYLLRLPPFIPANFISSPGLYDQVLRWNAQRARRAIRQALQELGWQKPMVINAFNPALGNMLAGQLGESQLVYYCYDEISAAPWIGRHGARHEKTFMGQVDLTIVSSTGLYASKSPLCRRCEIVKNGVDLSLFQFDAQRPADLPEGPVIGYLGSVDERIDADLLLAVARSFPAVSLIFVGRIMSAELADRLGRQPNIHLLGPRPPKALGAYVSAFTVGLIPFVKNDLTAGIYPLKINEYLAVGCPVVATDFADLSDFTGFISVGETTDHFIEAIQKMMEGHPPATINERRAFAAQQTWEKRADLFAHHLQTTPEMANS